MNAHKENLKAFFQQTKKSLNEGRSFMLVGRVFKVKGLEPRMSNDTCISGQISGTP